MSECIFCRIAAGEIPAKIVSESDEALAFHDMDPKAPVHVLIVPRKHLPAVRDAGTSEDRALLGSLLAFTARVAGELGLDSSGYRIVTNTGDHGGQSVDHLHFHLLGGRQMKWPPG
ncbi:MAG: histidine triad nucleotide-binding protein [Gemmatimonadales bacterium]